MPRVTTVEKARKDQGKCSKCGDLILAGHKYKWWAFMVGGRGGPKIKRCGKPECAPKPQDLTQSEYTRQTLDFDEQIGQLTLSERTIDAAESLKSDLENLAGEIEGLSDEQDEKFNNMPEGLQQGDSGQQLEARRDACTTSKESVEEAVSAIDTALGELWAWDEDEDRRAAAEDVSLDVPEDVTVDDGWWEDHKDELLEAIEEHNDEHFDAIEAAVEGISLEWE